MKAKGDMLFEHEWVVEFVVSFIGGFFKLNSNKQTKKQAMRCRYSI